MSTGDIVNEIVGDMKDEGLESPSMTVKAEAAPVQYAAKPVHLPTMRPGADSST